MATNPLSALSYTNKDFNSIYVELLDLVKQLTQKWDPSISNESDPGVILLKLDAIIGDKNNYNIDKNILEAFPETVTQEVNARNAYKQLAYKMPWYQSATTTITMRWVGEELADGVKVTIPRYTMVTNEDTSIIYTILDEPVFTNTESVVNVKAMEGTIVEHKVNGNSVIDLSNLDMSNRLFLNDYSVAENGVFITNTGNIGINLWTEVDNLQVKTLGNKLYEFGVDSRNGVCYIEFPDDIDALIGSGLEVRYLLSSGSEGNISAKVLDRFYEEKTIDVAGNTVALTQEVVEFYNSTAAVNGANPQELDDAFKAYRKTVGTFNTLVTLRDYINAIYNSGLISNGFVCDRNNDIQSTYTVVVDDAVNPTYTYIKEDLQPSEDIKNILSSAFETTINDEKVTTACDALIKSFASPELDAFDLRMYVLKNTGTIQNITQFESSFDMVASNEPKASEIKGYIQEQQCISHDFKDIKPDVPCMFQNSYPINIKIVPQAHLTANQIEEVKINIVKAFYNILNSRAIEFGEEPDYDIIYDAIYQADERIKTAILDDFTYTTFAIYWDSSIKDFKRIPINHIDELGVNQVVIFKTYNELENWQTLRGGSKSIKSGISRARRDAGYFIYVPPEGEANSIYKDSDGVITGTTQPTGSGWATLNFYDILRFDTFKEKFVFYSDKFTTFQRDILLKSILAGNTPWILSDTDFRYNLNHIFKDEQELSEITTGLTIAPYCVSSTDGKTGAIKTCTQDLGNLGEVSKIPMPDIATSLTNNSTVASYTLQPNETIRFLAPSFQTTKSFSNFVKFELVLKEGVSVPEAVESQGDLAVTGESYYIKKDDRARALYDCLSILTRLYTYINYHVRQESSEVLATKFTSGAVNKIYKKTSTNTYKSVEADEKYDETETYYTYSESGKYESISDCSKYCYSNKDALISADNILTSDYETIKTYVNEDTISETYADKESLLENIDLYSQWSKALSAFTDSSLKFVTGYTYIGYESKDTPKKCTVQYLKGSSQDEVNISLENYDNDIKQDVSAILEKLDNISEVHLQWRTLTNDDSFKDSNYCITNSLEALQSTNLETGALQLSPYDVAIHSAFVLNTISIYRVVKKYNIAPNTDYKLKDGESITFFWRKEDGDDTPYTYEHYVGLKSEDETAIKKSPIIRATFQLEGQEQSKFINLASSGEIKAGTPEFSIVNNMFGTQDLSGTKTIDIRQMNQVILDRVNGNYKQQNKYYFITKIKEVEDNEQKYVINFKLKNKSDLKHSLITNGSIQYSDEDASTILHYRYTLDNDEYFIYTSSDLSEYEVLGAGTLIGINVKAEDVVVNSTIPDILSSKVEALEYTKLIEGGIDEFKNKCLDIPRAYEMFCREQQIYTIAQGNKLYLTLTNQQDFVKANDELKNAAEKAINTLTVDLSKLKPYFCSWVDTYVQGFEVAYSDETGEHSLPKLSITGDSDCVWTARSYLNLNCAPNDSQEIVAQYDNFVSTDKKSSQFICYGPSGNKIVYPYIETSQDPSYDLNTKISVYLESGIILDKIGGETVDISYIDGTGESRNTLIYVYELNTKFDESPYNTRDDGIIEVAIEKSSESSKSPYDNSITLQKGYTYILKIENTSDKTKFTLKVNDKDVPRLGDKATACGYGSSFFKISLEPATQSTSDTEDLSISFNFAPDETSSDVLLIYPLVKGTLNPDLIKSSGSSNSPRYEYLFKTEDDLFAELQKLDNKSKFKYNHIVKQEYLIEDPLNSKSFFDQNHIYNSFTIGKAEIRLSEATGSSVLVVNNR